MIIKGGSRSNPKQLARHLTRTDTNERVEILELQNPSGSLKQTFEDWQDLSSLTHGSKGLYHANIDPDARYTMTREQWTRAVYVLEETLGFKDQPRAVVLHEKQGREHIHVVWQRTHLDREILLSDSQNYMKHEQASSQLEQEFGHERVKGIHIKADFNLPRPTQAFNHAAWQQAERTGQSPLARKEIITALYNKTLQTDAPAKTFQDALENQGYVLAKGDRRAFVMVDIEGEVHSLARNIEGLKTKELREYLSSLDLESMPTVESAKATQKEKSLHRESKAVKIEDLSALTIEAQTESLSDEKQAENKTVREGDTSQDFNQTATPSLTVGQERKIRNAEERFSAFEEDLAQRQESELSELRQQHIQTIADTFGIPTDQLSQWIMAVKGSRFVPEHLIQAELSRPIAEQEQRLAVLEEFEKLHAAEIEEIIVRQEEARQELDNRKQAELERLAESFERERIRAQEVEQAKLERQEARERERSLDDDLDFSRD